MLDKYRPCNTYFGEKQLVNPVLCTTKRGKSPVIFTILFKKKQYKVWGIKTIPEPSAPPTLQHSKCRFEKITIKHLTTVSSANCMFRDRRKQQEEEMLVSQDRFFNWTLSVYIQLIDTQKHYVYKRVMLGAQVLWGQLQNSHTHFSLLR